MTLKASCDLPVAEPEALIDRFCWAGCEFGDFLAIRRHCRKTLALTRERHHVVAYWRRGGEGCDTRRGEFLSTSSVYLVVITSRGRWGARSLVSMEQLQGE